MKISDPVGTDKIKAKSGTKKHRKNTFIYPRKILPARKNFQKVHGFDPNDSRKFKLFIEEKTTKLSPLLPIAIIAAVGSGRISILIMTEIKNNDHLLLTI